MRTSSVYSITGETGTHVVGRWTLAGEIRPTNSMHVRAWQVRSVWESFAVVYPGGAFADSGEQCENACL